MTTERVERRLAAIFAADVVGYSRLMAADEAGTLERFEAQRQGLIEPKIFDHHGRIVKLMGDGVLAEFASVVDAVQCAVEIQREMADLNRDISREQRIELRIGINLGDVIVRDDDIHGDGVNVAARLEQLADAGGIMISGTAFDHAKNKVNAGFEDLGPQNVKNIPEPVRAYRVLLEAEAAGTVTARAQTATEKAKRTRWMIAGAAAAVMIIGAAVGVLFMLEPWVPRVEAADPAKMAFVLPDKPSIAIMPFANLSGDPEQDYLADGIADAIITSLSQTEQLFVIARSSTFAYKGQSVPVKQVAEEFGVQHVLEGSFQKSADAVRVTARLIDALNGRQMWASRYDRSWSDVFALQDEITTNIVEKLQVELTIGEQGRVWRQGTDSAEAYQLMLKVREIFPRYTKEEMARARVLCERAISLDPDYAFAHALIAWVFHTEWLNGWAKDPALAYSRAMEEVEKALAIDDALAQAHMLLSWDYSLKGEHGEALTAGDMAVRLEPSGSDIAQIYSMVIVQTGRPNEAMEWFDRRKRIDPGMPEHFYWPVAEALRQLGRYEEMIELSKQILERTGHWWEHPRLAFAYMKMGREEEARAEVREMLAGHPERVPTWLAGVSPLPAEMEADFVDTLRQAGFPEPEQQQDTEEAGALPLPDKPSIAVLPFDNLSNDPEQEYFSDGVTEQIVAELTRFEGLFVAARNSTFRYKGRAVDVREVGRELGARYVLEGSVRRAANTIRVTAQLLDASEGAHLWAETYERGLSADSIFAVQDDITERVVGALAGPHGIISRARVGEAIKRETTSLSAYDCVLRVYAYRRAFRPEEHARVRDCLQRAVQLDPGYVDAWAWLALIYSDEYRYEYNTTPNALERSLAAAQRAVTLDRTSQLAHWILARTYFWLHQIDGFLTECEKAIALNANNSEVVASCGMYMAYTGQWERGVELTHKAIVLNPGHPDWFHFTFFSAHFQNGEYEQALAAARKINMPSFWWTYMALAAVHGQLGNQHEARAAIERLLELYPTFPDKPREILRRWNLPDSYVDRMIDGLREAGMPESAG